MHVIPVLLLVSVLAAQAAEPVRLHPDNPHYFLFRSKPTVLITSAEHYGAVVNLDFNYARYLDELRDHRLNLTRIFPGAYREVPGSFKIENNTLAPKPNRFIAPWPRTDQTGAADGGNKFDLMKWNDAYFTRLKDFVREAGRRGIVVEVSLFCPYYKDDTWAVSPLNIRNNVNNVGDVDRKDVLALKDGALTEVQDNLVRKIIDELKDFDNLYYEICNEPYFAGVTLEWQRHIAATIKKAEANQKYRHLIAQNIANGSKTIEDPDPNVSLFNFHYSRPAGSVAMNYHLNKAIGNNETGFDGQADAVYRIQGWEFILAGGALYNNLDYSFAAGHEDGTFSYPETQPGGGSRNLRRQLRHLVEFMERLDFVAMTPAPEVIRSGVPEGASARALAAAGKAYAIYLHHGRGVKDAKPKYQVGTGTHTAKLVLDIPAGSYKAEWIDTKNGKTARSEKVKHAGGDLILESPAYTEDAALRIELSR